MKKRPTSSIEGWLTARAREVRELNRRVRGTKSKARRERDAAEAAALEVASTQPMLEQSHVSRQQLRRAFPGIYDDRRAVCKRCNVELVDCEPMGRHPEHRHPAGDCVNASSCVVIEETVPFARKAYRRARRRGARLASRHRPK